MDSSPFLHEEECRPILGYVKWITDIKGLRCSASFFLLCSLLLSKTIYPENSDDESSYKIQLRFKPVFGSSSELSEEEHNKILRVYSNNKITSIFQDSTGFIWFGFSEGSIVRFDGRSINHYPIPRASKNYIHGDYINSIFEDSNGVLWLSTKGQGLLRFDQNKNLIKTYSTPTSQRFIHTISSNYVYD
jgi:hypothetical protein